MVSDSQIEPLLDASVVGRRLRGARIVAGFDRVQDACVAIHELGVSLSERTLYAIERGEQLPSWEQMIALMMVYDPPGGMRYTEPALRADAQEWFRAKRAEVAS